ncbi:MAG: HEAT repeat domain-containing protein [Phycisphaerales bacterium]
MRSRAGLWTGGSVNMRRTGLALVLGALASSLTGCGYLDNVKPGAKSLFDVVKPTETPAEAADMALDQYNPDSRYRGTLLLSNAAFGGSDIYIELYEDAARDEDAGVRWAGVRALGVHGSPEHVPLLIERLIKDPDRLVRAEAARALQRIHNPVAIDPLLQAIRLKSESEPEVRAAAADALGQYAERRVVQGLIAALNDPALVVNHATLKSLRTLTGQDFGLETRAWLDWVDSTDDLFAARTPYTYPAFQRDKRLLEYFPFMSQPPNETPSTPVGLPPQEVGG